MAEAIAVDQAVARTTTARRGVLGILAVLVLVVVGLLMLLLIGVQVGPVALAFGFLLATIPAPLYVYIALRVDRFEPEPARLLGWAFFWGATGATFIAFILNTAGQAFVGSQFGKDVGQIYGGSVSAPIVEEAAKAAVLFALYRWRRAEFDGALDGLIYAAMVGLGFAMTENILYYGRAAVEGGAPVAVIFFVRGVMSPLAHPVFTAMTGLGLGLAAQATSGARRVLAPALGLLGAMLLHSLWNTSTLGGGAGFFGVYFLIMVPIFIALIVVVAVGLRREGRMIASQLQPELASGALSQGDLLVLTGLRERRRLRRAARRDGGPAKRASREWVTTATELAFLRRRVQRGLPTAGGTPASDDVALVARLREVRATLGPSVTALLQEAATRSQQLAQAAASGAWQPVAPGKPATEWEPLRPMQVQPAAAQPAAAQPAAPPPPAAPASAPANWYPDPWAQARLRWWDGAQWTHHVAY